MSDPSNVETLRFVFVKDPGLLGRAISFVTGSYFSHVAIDIPNVYHLEDRHESPGRMMLDLHFPIKSKWIEHRSSVLDYAYPDRYSDIVMKTGVISLADLQVFVKAHSDRRIPKLANVAWYIGRMLFPKRFKNAIPPYNCVAVGRSALLLLDLCAWDCQTPDDVYFRLRRQASSCDSGPDRCCQRMLAVA